MSLNGALQVGQSAILASQAALSVAGNNMANAATPGYHRQRIGILPGSPESIGRGQFVGTGVQIGSITRQIDVALQARLRSAIGEQAGAAIDQSFLSSIEMLQGELSDSDISSELSAFFNSWSELANNPSDSGMRSLVLQQGESLAGGIRQLREDYNVLREEADRGLAVSVERADSILDQIAELNVKISETEGGAGQANTLRDQRDTLVDELSEMMDVTTIDQANGAVDVLVGSMPVVIAGESRGITMRTEAKNGDVEVTIRVKADGSDLNVSSGAIGGLLRQRAETIEPAIEQIDTFASELIFQVNRIHSQGQGSSGWDSATGQYSVEDPTVALGALGSGVPFPIENGSFFITVTNTATGTDSTHMIQVDPTTMSLNDLRAEITTSLLGTGVTASVGADGRLTIDAPAGSELTFGEDSSGALAALGLNSFFQGTSAVDISVSESLSGQPTLLATGGGGVEGSNATALAMVQLREMGLESLSGRSLQEYWQAGVNDLAVRTDAANTRLQGASLVRDSLDAQNASVSGVSLDEEAIDLLSYQRQFQAAARYLSIIDETLQSLLSIV